MVSSPLFLRGKRLLSQKEGLSLIEILIVATIITLLAILIITAFRPRTQMAKSRDARKKADLVKLKSLLEDYYNDHNCYPGDLKDLVSDYLDKFPSSLEGLYDYYSDCASYRLYTRLEYEKDPDIVAVGCEFGCGPGGDSGSCAYNYGLCSSNVGLEGCEEGGVGAPGCNNGCQGVICNVIDLDEWDCPELFCSSDCDGKCSDPAYYCTPK